MMHTEIAAGLNEAQQSAVAAPVDRHLLVLAGAGSGKTRVLVHRIAWLIREEQISPSAIFAVTFTNKAAREMRERIEQTIDRSIQGMWVGTFHGLAHRLLRTHWQAAGLPQTFQIMDAQDQLRFLKRLMKSMGLDEEKWAPKKVQWFINDRKDEGVRASNIDSQGDFYLEQQQKIYIEYEQNCARCGLVDFAELLLRAHELLLGDADLLAHYQGRFQHILVDEFQDTNALQYAWIRILAGSTGRVFVVGDDDQSIYGWRGAKIENIMQFERNFAGAARVCLEQNYRSTGNILSAANSLIAKNSNRLGKELWSSGPVGEIIDLYVAYNESDEARFVIERLRHRERLGQARSEVAVLYRSNAQSRVFEELLMAQSIPYRVYGGLRFFDRQEIKDALAYVRMLENRSDDAAFERIVNLPTRGVGDKTLVEVRDSARVQQLTLWNAALQMLAQGIFSGRAHNALQGFVDLIETIDLTTAGLGITERIETCIMNSGLYQHYEKDGSEKGQSRRENLEELINAARAFVKPEEDADLSSMASFLSHAALEAGEGQGSEWDDCIQLMTIHSAKGLEFPCVFMVGMEQGLFPHARSMEDDYNLEEERRLCYVGMTRAKQKLVISYAESRRIHGSQNLQRPSCFISEIPAELLNEVRPKAQAAPPVFRPTPRGYVSETRPMKLGQRVQHATFGEGVVLGYEGDGPSARVQVNFERHGYKWLVLSYAKLQAF